MAKIKNKKEVLHWLYGKCKFNVLVKNESDCTKCIHKKVCRYNMGRFCINYDFATSEFDLTICQSCLHKYTRYDKNEIPCFRCKYFKKK